MDWRNYLTAAHGYLDLGMGQEAWDELDEMPAQDRARSEVETFVESLLFD